MHIRVLLGSLAQPGADLDMLALQLTAALDAPILLYLSSADLGEAGQQTSDRLARAWRDLVGRVCRP